MAAETNEGQVKQMEQEITLLEKKKELLEAQVKLETAQANLKAEQAKEAFAELGAIKEAMKDLKLPEGKEGTITVAAGEEKAALLRSRRPLLTLLDETADALVEICPGGAVLMTEDQPQEAYNAQAVQGQIDFLTKRLQERIKDLEETKQGESVRILPEVTAVTYGLGLALDTAKSLAKLFRTDRKISVYDANSDALEILGYLLESKERGFVADPLITDDAAREEVIEMLYEKLDGLARQSEMAASLAERMKDASDAGVIRKIGELKAATDTAKTLLENISPTGKPDDFSTLVNGLVLLSAMREHQLLFLDVRAQTLQVAESRWYTGERTVAIGEVQVLYRLLDAGGSVKKSGVILKSSGADNLKLDQLEPLEWSRP